MKTRIRTLGGLKTDEVTIDVADGVVHITPGVQVAWIGRNLSDEETIITLSDDIKKLAISKDEPCLWIRRK